eukprot:1876306-Rhodomonas_salina.1
MNTSQEDAFAHRVYSSQSCTFDETLFPARQIDQRVYGYYDNQPVHEFRADLHAAKLNSTLVSDLPNLSPIPDPVWVADNVCVDEASMNLTLSCDMFAAPTVQSSRVNISNFDYDLTPHDIVSSRRGGSPTTSDVASTPGWGSPTPDTAPASGGGVATAAPVSAGDGLGQSSFPNPRRNKRGKRLRFGDKVPPVGEAPRHWRDCESTTLAKVSDDDLGEYLIGYAIEFKLPSDFYPCLLYTSDAADDM